MRQLAQLLCVLQLEVRPHGLAGLAQRLVAASSLSVLFLAALPTLPAFHQPSQVPRSSRLACPVLLRPSCPAHSGPLAHHLLCTPCASAALRHKLKM
jgi:hypothetical protein